MTKISVEHRDKLGRVITLGCYVAYPQNNQLLFGRVVKINPKMIGIESLVRVKAAWMTKHNKYPSELLILEDRDMTWYLLKNSQN